MNQITRKVLDKQVIIQKFASYLSEQRQEPADNFLKDHYYLDQSVREIQNFPWQMLALSLNLDRWRLYHWYFETFQRSLNDQINKEDLNKMKEIIKSAALQDIILDKQFQQHLKEQLSKDYHRSTFSIAFNNAKRQVYKETNRTEAPKVPFQMIKPCQQQQQTKQEKFDNSKRTIHTQQQLKDQLTQQVNDHINLVKTQSNQYDQPSIMQNEQQMIGKMQDKVNQNNIIKNEETNIVTSNCSLQLQSKSDVVKDDAQEQTESSQRSAEYYSGCDDEPPYLRESSFITNAVTVEDEDDAHCYDEFVCCSLLIKLEPNHDFMQIQTIEQIKEQNPYYYAHEESQ